MSMRKGDRIRVTTAPWVGELGVIEHVNGGYVNVRMDKSTHKDDVQERVQQVVLVHDFSNSPILVPFLPNNSALLP